jgi:CheY-like chemotaxis protein
MNKALTIMLIDDNETDNLISRRIIEMNMPEATLSCFSSGRLAIENLELNASSFDLLPDLIFLDMQMPVMNGLEFMLQVEKMVHRLAKTPQIVIQSAYEKSAQLQLPMPRILDFISKPISPEVFEKVLKELRAFQLKVA